MSEKEENKQKIDPCFLAWVNLLETLNKNDKNKEKL